MQEMKYISCIYHTVLFLCSKRSKIKFYTLLNNEDLQQKRATTNCFNHSADIDYKDFITIYKKCTTEPFSFLTIDTTLPVNDPLRFRSRFRFIFKSFRAFLKMTLTDELKILDDKIKANQAQFDLDRKAAKISAISFKELDLLKKGV